jgi:excisionase family DNA binding protein
MPNKNALLTTVDAARVLGLAVRSVQLMVDRGELDAWKTPGGHRRISLASVQQWQARSGAGPAASTPAPAPISAPRKPVVLLIEDSLHFQNLVRLLVAQYQPEADLHVVGDGVAGLMQCGQLQPDVLLIDIMLPGIDGATLINSLRTQAGFDPLRLIVITSLDESQRQPYAAALTGLAVIHKPRLAAELPPLLAQALRAHPTPILSGAS